jgi:signal peptidase II
MNIEIFKKRTPLEYVIYSAIIVVGVILDQLTKLLSVKFLMPLHTVPIIRDVIHLTYVENTGAAFGILKDQRWVFILTSTVTIIAILLYLYLGHAESLLYGVALSMICSGGIGNMIDRLALGYVVDFIDFRLINFAVFNGADSFVTVGACILILALLLDMKKELSNARGEGK